MRPVLMLVMRIMDVRMRVLHLLVNVLMFVMLGHMEPHADCHQASGKQQLKGEWLMQERNGDNGAEEWCR